MTARSGTRELFFELSVDMLCIADATGRFIDVNDAWTQTLGWSAHELCAAPFADFLHPDDVAATVNEAMSLGEGNPTVGFENRYQRKDGGYVWLSWRASSVPAPGGEPGERLIFAIARDVTERRRREDALRHLADHDELTGIWNRRRFVQEVETQVARCRRYDEHAALFLLDLDHFKEVNDTRGHAVGDALLEHLGRTLGGRLRASDSFARFGGDEFAILLPHLAPDEAAQTAEVVVGHLRDHPLVLDDVAIPITASVGVAFLDASTVSADAVMISADRAMYDAKARGRNRISGLRQPRSQAGARARVFHCDDSEAYRRLLAGMLEAHSDIEMAGGADSHATALTEIGVCRPHVVVLDALMGAQDPGAFIVEVQTASPASGVLVLSGLEVCPEALAGHADAFISKRSTFDDIADAIRAVAAARR